VEDVDWGGGGGGDGLRRNIEEDEDH